MGPATVLVVDDNEATTTVLRAVLSLDAHQPVVVYDGQSALTEIATGQIDLVLLDAGLPDMDGLEVCLRIRTPSPALLAGHPAHRAGAP